jgi:alkaline phosphatase
LWVTVNEHTAGVMRSSRTRWLVLIAVIVLVVGIAAYLLVRPYLPGDQPGIGLPSNVPTFRLPSEDASGSPAPSPMTMVAVGDIGSCDAQADDAVASLAKELGGTIASLGDTVYESGSDQEFSRCFDPAWGPMKSRIHPAVGNHEYETDGAAGYFDYFGRAAGQRGQGWYSYDLGAWHVVVLNSNCGIVACGASSPQVQWLRSDLSQADASCLLAYWHHPRWSSGRHGSQAFVQPFWDALTAAGVDVILNGHDHDYERVAVGGVTQFVVGTGGRSLYEFTKQPLPTTQVRSDNAYGALWLELYAGGYGWRFVGLGNTGFQDTGSGHC